MRRGDRRSARISARGRKKLTKRPVARTRRPYFATPDMTRARANIRLSGMSASMYGIKKRNPSAPRKTKYLSPDLDRGLS